MLLEFILEMEWLGCLSKELWTGYRPLTQIRTLDGKSWILKHKRTEIDRDKEVGGQQRQLSRIGCTC